MLNDTLKRRLSRDRKMTSITLRIPQDVVDSMKAIAPVRGMSGYQTLLKSYISEGLRRDEAEYLSADATRSEEHTSELQSLMRSSYAVFCLKKKKPSKAKRTYKRIRKQPNTMTIST